MVADVHGEDEPRGWEHGWSDGEDKEDPCEEKKRGRMQPRWGDEGETPPSPDQRSHALLLNEATLTLH